MTILFFRIFGIGMALFGIFGGFYTDFFGSELRVKLPSTAWTLAVFVGLFLQSAGETATLRSIYKDKNRYFSKNNMLASFVVAAVLLGGFIWSAK